VVVIKLYLVDPLTDTLGTHVSEYEREMAINLVLVESPHLVKTIFAKHVTDKCNEILVNGVLHSHYAYLVLPFYKNGTLLDLLIRVQ